ncbi:MAG: biopolymer transporter ExbD [Spirulinaceae cyanobacterium]
MTEETSQKQSLASNSALSAPPLKLWLDSADAQDIRIEIVPLIDVIFCILTFFILAAVGLSRQQAINLDLPEAKTGTPQMQDMLIVSLDYTGQVYLNQTPVLTKKRLEQAVKDYTKKSPNGSIVLRASRETQYNDVMEVLDILREEGGDRVSLATVSAGDESSPNLTPAPLPGIGSPGNNTPPGGGNSLPPLTPGLPGLPGQQLPSTPNQQPQQPPLGQPIQPGQPVEPGLTIPVQPGQNQPLPNEAPVNPNQGGSEGSQSNNSN